MSKLTYSGAEGGNPYNGGLLFGTTLAGGSENTGTVYALRLSGGNWSEKVILDFLGPNGQQPLSGLAVDASTNVLWGTTQGGGSESAGVAFSLTPGNHLWSSPWTEKILYNFCWALTNPCTDGRGPAGILRDASGNLYGAALDGGVGSSPGNGIVFKLTDDGCSENNVPGFWCSTTIYNFCSSGGSCSDGSAPSQTSELVMDGSGNLYGTTTRGGNSSNGGVVYELSGTSETVLHSFCAVGGCTDGKLPEAGVILDSAGNLYGTTRDGGSGSPASGTAFRITP